jgi:hypothetical protein
MEYTIARMRCEVASIKAMVALKEKQNLERIDILQVIFYVSYIIFFNSVNLRSIFFCSVTCTSVMSIYMVF